MTNVTIFLIITGTVVIVVLLIFRFVINLSRRPVPEINLSAVDNPGWSDTWKMADLVDSMLRNGFEAAGSYSCSEIPSLIISGYVRPSERITGVIYDHPVTGIWVDFCVQYADGGSLTVSNAPAGHEMDHMPQQAKIYLRGSSVDELLQKLFAERKKTERTSITKEEFPSYFEEHYKKEMKWRIDRGGPTSAEIMRVGNAIGKPPDIEKLQNAMWKINKIWIKRKKRSKEIMIGTYEPSLPEVFQEPDIFRQKMEQKSSTIPKLNLPAAPVYLAFVAALACWGYYGYQYNKSHFPVSLTAIIIFSSVFVAIFIGMMIFHGYHRSIIMTPVLKRMADSRPGAFLVMRGASPFLFYAKERWIGKVSFYGGSEDQKAFTRMDAVTKYSIGSLSVSKRTLIGKIFSDKYKIMLPESDFSRKFAVSGTDTGFAEKLLNHVFQNAVLRLEEIGKPYVEIERNAVSVEIGSDLSGLRKEALLKTFLEEAERIIDATVRQTVE
jgi:hypothetical protein